jgi:hypothetical protein
VHNIAKAVAALGVAAAVTALAACSDSVAPTTSGLRPGTISFSAAPKVTVCHAAGRAGTTKYVSITISANGANAHFTNNGTPKAGHELDFLSTPARPCNAPAPAQLKVCKLSSANDPTTADPNQEFAFTTSDNTAFSLKFTACYGPVDVVPGDITLTEAHDLNAPSAFSYYATSFTATGGTTVSSSGFSGPPRPTIVEDAIVTVTTTSGNLTTVTFYNRN